MDVFSSEEYKRSRSSYSIFCMLEYFVALSATDAYLSKLLQSLGFTDAQIGVLSAISSVAFLFALSSLFTAGKIRRMKRYIIIGSVLSEIVFSLLFLIPFLHLPSALRLATTVVCLLTAYYFRYSVEAMLSRWANSYVHPNERASYSAGKEMMSLIGGTIYILVLGFAVDYFEEAGKLSSAFLLISFMILIFSAGSCFFLKRISGTNAAAMSQSKPAPFRKVFRETFGRKGYRTLVLVHILSNCAYYTTISFMGTYKLSELAFSVGAIQIINIAGNVARIFLSKPIGRYSDTHSYAKGISLGLTIYAVAYTFNIFTTPSTRFLVILFTLLTSTGMCGTSQNMENALYSYVPAEYYVQASIMKSCIAGASSFAMTLVGSAVLNAVQQNGNMVFGVHLYGQQFLSMLSLLIVFGDILLCRLVLEKQKNMHQ